MEEKLRFRQLLILRTHLTLWYPEKHSVLRMKLMITKKSSQETLLVRAIPATLLLVVNSRKRSFLQVNANGLRMRLTHHQGAVCFERYPRWSRRWFVITININMEKTDHNIGMLWNHCWENLHRKEQGNFLTSIGFIWFSKAAVRPELNPAWITRNPYFIYELFRVTQVVFQ